MEINPEQFNEWIEVLWNIGWRGLIVFAIIYYREAVIILIKMVAEILTSWLKKN